MQILEQVKSKGKMNIRREYKYQIFRARSALSTAPQTPSKRRCSSADKPLDLSTTSNVKSDESARSSSETVNFFY